jgi:copper(I)-binding protein
MRRRLLLAMPLALAALDEARAHSYKLGNIEIGHPWARPSATRAAAVFLALSNLGRSSERLSGGATPIAKEVALCDADGAALDELDLLPHHPVALRPGGKYIALRGLAGPLALDDSFPLTLHFDHAGDITVTVMVEAGPQEG